MATVDTKAISIQPALRRAIVADPSAFEYTNRTSLAGSPRNSSGSTKSWDETISEMAIGLQQICGSPMSAPLSPRMGPMIASDRGSPRLSTARQLFNRPDFRRAESLYGSVTRSKQQKLVVRHIETQEQLRSQLSAICCPRQRRDSDSFATGDVSPESSSPDFFHKPSLLECGKEFKVRVAVKSVPIEDLYISLQDQRLQLKAFKGPTRILLDCNLPEKLSLNKLLCVLLEKDTILIRENKQEIMKLESGDLDCVYLPIVFTNPTTREVTIVVHVPDEFTSDDVAVKTVDSSIIISCSKKSYSPGSRGAQFVFGSASERNLPSMSLSLQLPEGADSRSVCASLAKRNQLVIKCRLGPASRRYSV